MSIFARFPVLTGIVFFMMGSPVFAQNGTGFNPASEHYLWPTDASSYLSSTFGETRSAHFHAALDIKTWGRKGYRVFATRNGILHRIAVEPKGYGKVVYLKHPDGSYSVYAHLLSFSEPIQHLADSLRMIEYSYELDRTLDSLAIPVKQGEVIGYTGATGIGPPHLHFELRDPDNKPFNPLLTNLSVPDNIPPQFSGMSVEPLSISTEIEGKNRILTIPARKKNGDYDFGTVHISGQVGLGVNVFDQANSVPNAYAVYKLELYVNGEKRFQSTVDSFSYLETGQMFLDRVYPLLLKTGEGFQRLYRADGNSLPFYSTINSDGGGRLNLPPGSHHIRIAASDYFGNRSSAAVMIEVGTPRKLAVNAEPEIQSTGIHHPADWVWHSDWITMPGRQAGDIILVPRGQPSSDSVAYSGYSDFHLDLEAADSYFIKTGTGNVLELRRTIPGKFHITRSLSEEAYAIFDKHTFYDTLSVGMITKRFAPDSVQIDLFPFDQPLQKAFSLLYTLDSNQSAENRWGFYRKNTRENRLEYIPTTRIGDYLWGEANYLGTYYLLRDTIPPALGKPSLLKREDGKWVITVPATDNLSDIDYTRSTIYVNGIRGILEYEPEDDRIVYYHPTFEPKEENLVHLYVYDHFGNHTEMRFKLRQ